MKVWPPIMILGIAIAALVCGAAVYTDEKFVALSTLLGRAREVLTLHRQAFPRSQLTSQLRFWLALSGFCWAAFFLLSWL